MYAIPPELPPYTIVEEQRLDELTSKYGIARSGKKCEERTSLIFLRQVYFMLNSANKLTPNSKEYYNHINLATGYYNAYLYYSKK